MSLIFEGPAQVRLSRFSTMPDSIALYFSDCLIFTTPEGKWEAHFGERDSVQFLVGDSFESAAQAYEAVQKEKASRCIPR